MLIADPRPYQRRHFLWLHRASNLQLDHGCMVLALKHGLEYQVGRRIGQAGELDISHHSDDFDFLATGAQKDAPANRALARKQPPRRSLGQNRHLGSPLVVARCERPAGKQRDPQGCEVIAIHKQDMGTAHGRSRVSGCLQSGLDVGIVEGREIGQGGGLNAGRAVQRFRQARRLAEGRPSGHGILRGSQPNHGDVAGHEARGHGAEVPEAANEHRGAGHHGQRERHLHNHQCSSGGKPGSHRAFAGESRAATQELQRRSEAEQKAGYQRYRQAEPQHPPVGRKIDGAVLPLQGNQQQTVRPR